MQSVGKVGQAVAAKANHSAQLKAAEKLRAAGFAALKTEWLMQVAADRTLSETSLRVALCWSHWLNSKSLLAWPSQSTIAKAVNSQPRAVRDALKRLETGGHLFCTNAFRGGRKTNNYRIVLQDIVICEDALPNTESGTAMPLTVARTDLPEGAEHAVHNGADEPMRGGVANRGTLERTLERTNTRETASISSCSSETQSESRASKAEIAEIMREAYGAQNVNENGHLLRKC